MYIIHAPSIGLVKIGISREDPEIKRFKQIAYASPVELVLAYSLEVDDPYVNARRFERYVHGKLHKQRTRGEWFAVSITEAISAVEAAYENRICNPKSPVDDRFPKSMNKKYFLSPTT